MYIYVYIMHVYIFMCACIYMWIDRWMDIYISRTSVPTAFGR